LAFVFVGAHRDRAIQHHLAAGHFEPLDPRVVWTLTAALLLLGSATMVLLILVS
jgi:hypothetical protein